MKKFIIIGLMLLFLPSPVFAEIIPFFGEDEGTGDNVPLTSWVNSDAAYEAFFNNLEAELGTEDFEDFTPNSSTVPLELDFGEAGTATLNGIGFVVDIIADGLYPISGDQYWLTSSYDFFIEFSDPISALGFFATDVGDQGGQLSLSLTLTDNNNETTEILIENSFVDWPSGSVLYYGFYDLDNSYTSVAFGNTEGQADTFGFDDFTIATSGQIVDNTEPVPEPATIFLVGGPGLAYLVRLRRRRRGCRSSS